MSAVVKFVDKVVSPVMDSVGLGDVWDAVVDAHLWFIDKVVEPIAAFIFGLLGIKDQDIVTVNASYVKLTEEVDNTFIKALIKNIRVGDPDAGNNAYGYHTVKQRKKFNSPFYLMDAFETVQTPVSEIHSNSLDYDTIEKNLRIELNVPTASVFSAITSVPNTNEYIRSMLHKLYGLVDDVFSYNGEDHTYVSSSLDAGNGYYIVEATDSLGDPAVIPTIVLETPQLHYIVKYNIGLSVYYFVEPIASTLGKKVVPEGALKTVDANFMPIIPIRENGVNVNGVSDSTYISYYNATINKQSAVVPKTNYDTLGDRAQYVEEHDIILRQMGLTMDNMTATVCSRPNAAELDELTDANVMFTMDAKSTNPAVMKAIFEMAKILSNATPDLSTVGSLTNTSTYGRIVAGRYNIAYNFTASNRVYRGEGESSDIGKCFTSVNGDDLVVYKQVNEVTREEYTLGNLTAHTAISHGGFANMVSSNLNDSETPIFIPIVFDSIRGLTASERAELFLESFRLVVFSLTVEHLEWYKTPAFLSLIKIIIIIVVIIISIVTFGAGAAPATAAGAAAVTALTVGVSAATAATITAIVAAVESIIISTIIAEAGKMVAANISKGAESKLQDTKAKIKAAASSLDAKLAVAKEKASELTPSDILYIMSDDIEYSVNMKPSEYYAMSTGRLSKLQIRNSYAYSSTYDRNLDNINVHLTAT